MALKKRLALYFDFTLIKKFNSVINLANSEAIIALEKISDLFSIKHIFSHEETGNQLSYDRDKRVKEFCKKQLHLLKRLIHKSPMPF